MHFYLIEIENNLSSKTFLSSLLISLTRLRARYYVVERGMLFNFIPWEIFVIYEQVFRLLKDMINMFRNNIIYLGSSLRLSLKEQ